MSAEFDLLKELRDVEFPTSGSRRPPEQRLRDALARWRACDQELHEDEAQALARLWRHHPEWRELLVSSIGRVPHRAWVGLVEGVLVGFGPRALDWEPWLALEPTLGPVLKSHVVKRSRRFKDVRGAVHHALVWARFFEGGQPAWDAMANALKHAWLQEGQWPPSPDLAVLCEEMMGVLSSRESQEVEGALRRVRCFDAFGDVPRFF